MQTRMRKSNIFFHRDFLGAHRYTTRGGTCVLRRPLHGAGCLSTVAIRGNGFSPSLRYPFTYFAFDEGLKFRPSSSTKSVGGASTDSYALLRKKARSILDGLLRISAPERRYVAGVPTVMVGILSWSRHPISAERRCIASMMGRLTTPSIARTWCIQRSCFVRMHYLNMQTQVCYGML